MKRRSKTFALKKELEDYFGWLTRFKVVSPMLNIFLEELEKKVGKNKEWVLNFLEADDEERRKLIVGLFTENNQNDKKEKNKNEFSSLEERFKSWW